MVFYIIGKRLFFYALECVLDQRLVAVRGHWVDSNEPEGLVCMYASMDRIERVIF